MGDALLEVTQSLSSGSAGPDTLRQAAECRPALDLDATLTGPDTTKSRSSLSIHLRITQLHGKQ